VSRSAEFAAGAGLPGAIVDNARRVHVDPKCPAMRGEAVAFATERQARAAIPRLRPCTGCHGG
jgi:hypothetical protein